MTCFISTTNDQHSEIAEEQGTSEETGKEQTPYSIVPRTEAAVAADDKIKRVKQWLETLERPKDLSDTEYKSFMRYSTDFFVTGGQLWRKDPKKEHKLVIFEDRRLFLLSSAHDDVGNWGFYATNSLLTNRYWWPMMSHDIAWFIKTCRLCQLRKTQQVLIPPVIATPAPLFAKVYMDTMHLPPSAGYKYIVQAGCSLIHWPEWKMLRQETSRTLGLFILHNIIQWWGTLMEIVTDNGPAFLKALEYLAKHYHINHIRISGYNSRANGIVERSHFDVRQAVFKACNGDQSKWSSGAPSVFWSEQVTIQCHMGCSPYIAATGTHPILPFDIAEANYLLPPPNLPLTTTDLIARRAIALQKRRSHLIELHKKVYAARLKAAIQFEKDHAHSIRDYNF
jgi:hypothetical protein